VQGNLEIRHRNNEVLIIPLAKAKIIQKGTTLSLSSSTACDSI